MSINSDNLIKAKLSDAVEMMELKNIPSFLGFLNEREFSTCKSILEKRKIKYFYFGGYESADRVYIAVLPDWAESVEYPFCALKFSLKANKPLSHRDYLGTLMSLGVVRDKIGDILCFEDSAYAFVSESIAPFCIDNISCVGGVGVFVEAVEENIEFSPKFEEIRAVVASDRADCVIGGITHLAREKAKSYILSGNVTVNHIVCESITQRIKTADVLSLKGYGKYIIDSIDDKTRKGRTVLICKKYI